MLYNIVFITENLTHQRLDVFLTSKTPIIRGYFNSAGVPYCLRLLFFYRVMIVYDDTDYVFI